MKWKTLGFWVGVVFAVLHAGLVLLAFSAMTHSRSSTAGLAFVPFFFLDAPLLILPSEAFQFFGKAAPLIEFGVVGSAMWLLIPWLIDTAIIRLLPKRGPAIRVTFLVVLIPLVYVGFFALSATAVRLAVERQRPSELKPVLNQASSAVMTEKVVFEDPTSDRVDWISSITRMQCRPGAGTELLVGLPNGIAFLNDNYQEQTRLNLSDQRFMMVEPLGANNAHPCRFLAYQFQKGVYLFGSDGKEMWKIVRDGKNEPYPSRVEIGDVDGDGSVEIALEIGEGISLVDDNGKLRWKHRVLALGHLEIADVHGNGKGEVVYTNANNADGVTTFTFLNANGSVVKQLKLNTHSFEFAIVRWSKASKAPNILLTEDNKIRIVDMKGNTIHLLDAPGCRAFGEVKVATVRFDRQQPEYLAVRKRLFPDISVLYVYDPAGRLAYQKNEVIRGVPPCAIAAVPAQEAGAEKLLVGSARGHRAVVEQYMLATGDN